MAERLPAVHHRFGIKPEPLTAKVICDGVVSAVLGVQPLKIVCFRSRCFISCQALSCRRAPIVF